MLSLKRGYWIVESRLHHCLDITLREDESRVRTPNVQRQLFFPSAKNNCR
jgi:hypothetical protein